MPHLCTYQIHLCLAPEGKPFDDVVKAVAQRVDPMPKNKLRAETERILELMERYGFARSYTYKGKTYWSVPYEHYYH